MRKACVNAYTSRHYRAASDDIKQLYKKISKLQEEKVEIESSAQTAAKEAEGAERSKDNNLSRILELVGEISILERDMEKQAATLSILEQDMEKKAAIISRARQEVADIQRPLGKLQKEKATLESTNTILERTIREKQKAQSGLQSTEVKINPEEVNEVMQVLEKKGIKVSDLLPSTIRAKLVQIQAAYDGMPRIKSERLVNFYKARRDRIQSAENQDSLSEGLLQDALEQIQTIQIPDASAAERRLFEQKEFLESLLA